MIVSKSNWPISIDSNPGGALVTIANKAGREVFRGTTPAAMKLKSGSGFFSKESYTVTFEKQGYETRKVTVECRLNGWYFGNLIFGGFLGLLIVDPATGAMFKLDKNDVTENLSKSTEVSLNIIDKNSLSPEAQKHLVKLN